MQNPNMHLESSPPTSLQEAANALSMMVPSAVLFLRHMEDCKDPQKYTWILLAFTLFHMPFGTAYHAGAALGVYECRLNNTMRKLDQTMQHMVACAFSFALSGSYYYMALNTVPNAYWTWKIWQHETSGDGKRWVSVGHSIALYTLPMLWRGDLGNYLLAMGSIALGGFAGFVPRSKAVFGAWGHTGFHMLLGIYADALARSVTKMH